MSVAPTVQDFINDFQSQPPRLRLSSTVDQIKFIGRGYATQMANHGTPARTVRDLLRNTANLSRAAIRQLLAEYTKNANANTCINRGGPRAGKYHVRDFSFPAFNSLRNMLAAARQLGLGRQGHARQLPAALTAQRDAAMATCQCHTTQALCTAAGNSCSWQLVAPAQRALINNQTGRCVPRTRQRRRGAVTVGAPFPGIKRNAPGQKKSRRNQRADPGQTFIGVWRVPE